MKIACDCQISKRTVELLKANNFDVVFRAHKEPDEVWIEAALDLGATVFISPDLDIPLYLDKVEVEYKWIDVRQGLRSGQQFSFLVKRLKKIKEELKTKAIAG